MCSKRNSSANQTNQCSWDQNSCSSLSLQIPTGPYVGLGLDASSLLALRSGVRDDGFPFHFCSTELRQAVLSKFALKSTTLENRQREEGKQCWKCRTYRVIFASRVEMPVCYESQCPPQTCKLRLFPQYPILLSSLLPSLPCP